MSKSEIPQPRPQIVYGQTVYWLSITAALICTLAPIAAVALPGKNVLDPHFLFSSIWAGKKPEAIWQAAAGGFPGGHFWLHNLPSGDAIIQLGIALGCSCAGIGLLAASIAYLKEKKPHYGWAIAALVIAVFVALAAAGIYQQSA
jgi:hypothetical protein